MDSRPKGFLTWEQAVLRKGGVGSKPRRPKWTNERTIRAGSPGVFSEYKHFDGEIIKRDLRTPPRRESPSRESKDEGSPKGKEADCTPANGSQQQGKLLWHGPSPHPGIPDILEAEAKSPPPKRSYSSSPQLALSGSVVALLHRDMPSTHRDPSSPQVCHDQVKRALTLRYGDDLTKSSRNGGGPSKGLRVDYYHKGRKLTTAQLLGLEDCSPPRAVSRSPEAGGPLNEDQEKGAMLWLKLHELTDRLRHHPNDYIEELRQSRRAPNADIESVLHYCILLLELNSVVPLPKSAVWNVVRDVMRPGDFLTRIADLRLEQLKVPRAADIENFLRNDRRDESASTEAGIDSQSTADTEAVAAPSKNRTLLELHETFIKTLKERAPLLADLCTWVMLFLDTFNHIVRDKKASL